MFWVAYVDATGRRKCQSTGLRDEELAQKLLGEIERRVDAEIAAGVSRHGPLTVRRYGEKWIEQLRSDGVGSADTYEQRLKDYAYPSIGNSLLVDVRRHHVKDWFSAVRKRHAGRLANRTIRGIYDALRALFADALAQELIESSPCSLRQKAGELPPKTDKDPYWRANAVYAREEVEALISDDRIPLYRRTLYGLMFLTGMRIGEVCARRWRDWDAAAKPLGRLTVATSYNLKRKLEKGTKTDVVRYVPVHPTLDRILTAWRAAWPSTVGRQRASEDFLVPGPGKGKRATWLGRQSATSALKRLHEDCATIGIRPRGQHDMRATCETLASLDGANDRVMHVIVWGPKKGDVQAGYLRLGLLSWTSLCHEIGKLNVQLRTGATITVLDVSQPRT